MSYSLDAFELTLDEDGRSLTGLVKLRNGTRPIKFTRLDAGESLGQFSSQREFE
jgi:hypothetical protein